jgi:outer membrane protein OmpA-like peptidoglycan-associated protein
MKTLKGILAAGLLTGLSTAAQAQDYSWYLGAELGVSLLNDTTTTADGVRGATRYSGTDMGKSEGEAGWAILGQVGAPITPWLRLEGELGYRANGLDRKAGNRLDGDLDILSYMVNAYVDIPTGGPLTPYIGVGAGGATIWNSGTAGVFGSVDDSDTVFAYQGIAGLAYRLSPEVSIKADYRYFATTEATFATSSGVSQSSDFDSHTFMVGFTYHFGTVAAPAPAPTPAPAPVAAPAPRNFIVFFDWDKADLTPEAQSILRQAAEYIKKGGVTRITLTGHADRSGTDSYNVRLSERRGQNVKKFLASLGVASNSMSIVAKGESQPLVPTADNVREPQNRRVEIVM